MRTFRVRNGDISIGPGGYTLVDGEAKLKQDLALSLREPFGSDHFHPRWGSLLPDYIGHAISSEMQSLVNAEVQRIVSNYMVIQGKQIQQDAVAGRRSRFNTSEIITAINGVKVTQSGSALLVQIALQTAGGQSISIIRSVQVI